MKRFFLTKLFPSAATLAGIATLSSTFTPVQAASLSFSLSPFTGSAAKLNFTLDDKAAGEGNVLFKVDVDKSVSLADIRGIFFNIKDDSLLSSLKITGTDVTAFKAAANAVSEVGSSNNNLNGGGTNYAFDVGVEIGQEGLKGGDDFQSTSFVVSAAKALDLSQFSSQGFGARLMSVGTAKSREDSSKLIGSSPNLPPVVPPTTPPSTPPVVPPTTPPPTPPVVPPTTPPVVPPTTPPPTLPPVVVVPPSSTKPPAKVPEPGTIAALGLAAVGAAKFLKRKEEAKA